MAVQILTDEMYQLIVTLMSDHIHALRSKSTYCRATQSSFEADRIDKEATHWQLALDALTPSADLNQHVEALSMVKLCTSFAAMNSGVIKG